MIYLVLSILSTALLFIIFKFFQRLKIDTFQAVVVNYLTAAALGGIINLPSFQGSIFRQSWIEIAMILGVLFISVFYLLGYTAQKIGVSVSSVANKMSMVIPVIAAVELYNDRLNLQKILGIIIALSAVVLTSLKKKSPESRETLQPVNRLLFLVPFLLFLGSGILDSLLNFAQAVYLREESFGIFITCVFAFSGLIGTTVILFRLVKGETVKLHTVFGGMILGTVNYFSVYFFLNSLEIRSLQSSVILPVNNIGVVLCSTLAAYFIFREKLSVLNWTGILLAVISILVISFS